MWRFPDTAGLVAMVMISCLLLFMGPTHSRASNLPASSSECRASYELGELENQTVEEYHNYTGSPRSRTILAILSRHVNSSSREDIATAFNISMECLGYLDFTLPEVALFLLNTSQFKEVTFDNVFRGVFVSEIESILRSMLSLHSYLKSNDHGQEGNRTLQELALAHNVSLNKTSVLELLLLSLNKTDVNVLASFLEIRLSSFDLLNRTTEDLAVILALSDAGDLKNYTFLQLMKISFAGEHFIHRLEEARASLHFTWHEITEDVVNVTNVLDLLLAKVPIEVHYLIAFSIGVMPEDLQLLNITLEEFAELVNMTVMQFRDYKVYPRLINFIVKTKRDIVAIDRETKMEIRGAIHEILSSYKVTLEELIHSFNFTEHEIQKLSPLKIEILCARFTLIRYVTNLNMTLAEVAVKLNRTEAELSYNLTVKEFHVVIRKLLIVRTFEVMSQMLGVSQDFLVNSLNIQVPVSSLSMCQLDAFLNVTRHTVLGLGEVVNQKTLAFVVQINGVSITFVYKLTIEQFITQIMHLDVHYFFTLNGLHFSYKPSRLKILLKYKFFELERLFHLNGDFSMYRFVIFRHSLVWIINRIIYLNETGKTSFERFSTVICGAANQIIQLVDISSQPILSQALSGSFN